MAREKKSYDKRLGTLRAERSGFIDYWRELSDIHLAHRGRFLTSDRNKGHKRNTKQYNNTSRLAVRTIASGMMAGITSPARPWFRLRTSDPVLNESGAVKEWLHDVEGMMREVFNSSNLYNSLHVTYAELAVFGTASMGVFSDYENVIWCKPYTVGSYSLGMNGKNIVDTQYREYELTVAQMVDEFGLEYCSNQVKNHWKKGSTETWIKVVHVIEPNDDRDALNPMAKHKRYRSVYYEAAHTIEDQHQFLRESGFDEFPILTPRWDVTGEDIYGTDCPGMVALGDTKTLQLQERRKYQAIDKVVNPPVQAPSSLRNKISGGNLVSGEIVFVDDTANGGVKSLYDYRPDLAAMQASIDINEERIKRSFYEDLFLMLSNSDRRQITAREISERHEEKLLMLGPVLERLHTELLDPLIDRTFNIMQQAGILPDPPEELKDSVINVEYVSVLAQAQMMVGIGALERTAQFAGSLVEIWPEARHKFDALQAMDDYSEAMGVSPHVVRSDDEVAGIMDAEKAAAQEQKQAEQAAMATDMAGQAASMDTSGQNVLTDVMRMAGIQPE